MSERMERMHSLLNESFAPVACELIDDSHLHTGHAGAASGAGHYRLKIVANAFKGLGRIARHRLVYDCLNSMMETEIHALNITALAPSEHTS